MRTPSLSAWTELCEQALAYAHAYFDVQAAEYADDCPDVIEMASRNKKLKEAKRALVRTALTFANSESLRNHLATSKDK